jgi:hypothetical protein
MVGSLAFCISVGGVFDVETKGHLESIVRTTALFLLRADPAV